MARPTRPRAGWWTRELEAEIDLESAAAFISGESELYPAFAAYVESDNQDWLAQQYGADDDDAEDEQEPRAGPT